MSRSSSFTTGRRRVLGHGAISCRLIGLIVLLASGSAQGIVRTWDGGGSDNNASTDENWAGDIAPLAGDDIVLNGTSNKDMTWDASAPDAIGSWTQANAYSGTVTLATVYPGVGPFTNLAIAGNCVVDNGAWKHLGNNTTEDYRLRVSVDGNFTLASNAVIDLDILGYYRSGPGYPPAYGTGPAHGGRGGNGLGTTYGDLASPTNLGSGGNNGNRGGGALYLTVAGAAQIDGSASAEGNNGSGGSILITAGTFGGNGTISVDGGPSSGSYQGGGGRISVVLSGGDTFGNVTMTAYGSQHGSGRHAAAGTIYTEGASGLRTVTVDNNDLYYGGETTTAIPTGQAWTVDRIVVGGKGILDIPTNTAVNLQSNDIASVGASMGYIRLVGGSFSLPGGAGSEAVDFPSNTALLADGENCVTGDLDFAAGALLGHSAIVAASARGNDMYAMALTILGDLAIHTGAQVNADFLGYYRLGPGRGAFGQGGSHGGTEDDGGGPTYGSIISPVNSGSGGNNGNVDGGAIGLAVTGNTLLGGEMSANGEGGAGGSIRLRTGTLTGGGSIEASGGDRNSYNGGGGRVSVILTNAGATFVAFDAAGGTTAAYGGERISGTAHAAAGTVYRKDSGSEQLILDNRDKTPNDDATTCHLPATFTGNGTYAAGNFVFEDDLSAADTHVRKGGRLTVATNKTLGSLTVTNSCKFTIENQSTLFVGSLIVDGTNFAPGQVYSVTEINDAVGSTLALGDGYVSVGIPSISSRPATNIAPTSANLNGYLHAVGGAAPEVIVYWGTTDGGTNKNAWGATNSFGAVSVVGALTTNVGLTPDTVYFYRHYSTNAYEHDWADSSEILLTGELWLDGIDTNAAEVGLDPGTCLVFRASSATNGPITVDYSVSGTAEPGVDYVALSGTVTIAEGEASAAIVVTPIADDSLDAETVIITIADGPYMIGASNAVTITIEPPPIPAGYNTWIGGDPASTSSWSQGHLPTNTDHVLLAGFSHSDITWDAPLSDSVASWTQTENYPGTVTFATVYPGKGSFTNLAIAGDCVVSNGVWNHLSNTSTEHYRLRTSVASNFTLGSNAQINVDILGYYRAGPGYPPVYGRGPAHGGRGNSGLGATYGDLAAPTNLGSGGNNGNRGGGAVYLTVGGDARIDGVVSAEGNDGSGGSVLIEAGTFGGDGAISADGGPSSGSYQGGGGRIAVVLSGGDTFGNVAMTAYGSPHGTDRHAAAGTVYTEGGSGLRTVTVDNTNLYYGGETTTAIPTGQAWTVDRIVVGGKGILDIPTNTALNLQSNDIVNAGASMGYIRLVGGSFSLPGGAGSEAVNFPSNTALMADGANAVTGDLEFAAGALLTHSAIVTPGARGDDLYRMDLAILGDLTIHTGAQVNADFLGYYRLGPGRGAFGQGGSHGGTEDDGGGPTYGSIISPVNSGSGGNNGNVGGGAIGLAVTGNTLLGGEMSANGEGGAGGSIRLRTGTLTGGGSIEASGGDRNSYNGGGGRVSVTLTDGGATFSAFDAAGGTMAAYGGERISGTGHAAAGTVYREDAIGATILIDNRGKVPNDDFTTCHLPPTFAGNGTYPAEDFVFDDDLRWTTIDIRDGGHMTLTTNSTAHELLMETNAAGINLGDPEDVLTLTTMTIHGTNYTRLGFYRATNWNGFAAPPDVTGDGAIYIKVAAGTVLFLR